MIDVNLRTCDLQSTASKEEPDINLHQKAAEYYRLEKSTEEASAEPEDA